METNKIMMVCFMHVVEIDPKNCVRWKFADRSGFEFGDIFALSQDIQKNGQIEPAILRNDPSHPGKYEVIAGSRRWKACLEEGIALKAIVQNLTDEQAAVVQIKENQKVPLCDYSKGIHYSKLLKEKKLTLTFLSELLGISRAKLDNYLAFEKIPTPIWDAVGNLSRLSSRSAATIYSLSKKGKDYVAALIELAEDIRKGTGSKTLEKKVLQAINGHSETLDYQQSIFLPSGQPIAKWTKNGIQFAKDIPLNQEEIANTLVKYFQDVIKN